MAVDLYPVLGFYDPVTGSPIKDNLIEFGYVSPGGYTKEISLDLWNNKHPNPEIFVRRDRWGNIVGIDETTEEAKALNASFKTAYAVKLVPSARDLQGNYARIERFKVAAPAPKATDTAPVPDWFLEYQKYEQITKQWGAWTRLDPDAEFVCQLDGHRLDPQTLMNPAQYESSEKDKHVIFKLRMFVPANAAIEDFRFYLRPTYKDVTGRAIPPAGPGASNYL